jgi:prepilin-type processing-associated H-X9-DG protein
MQRKILTVIALFFVTLLGASIAPSLVIRARLSARNVECQYNLKNIGSGLNAYTDTKPYWPYGTVPNNNLPPEKRLSWYVEAWKFFDQSTLVMEMDKSWDSPNNLEPMARDMEGGEYPVGYWKAFSCPAAPDVSLTGAVSATNYVGISGIGGDYAATLPVSDPWAGLFGYDRRCKETDITNGMSNTMAVAETLQDNGPWTAGGRPTVRGLDQSGPPYLGKAGQFNSAHYTLSYFTWSKHSYSTNILFADGSVRSFTDDMDASTLEAMATIHRRPNGKGD